MEDWRKLAAASERHQEKIPERRKSSGSLSKFISIFGFVSWLLVLPILVLIAKAKPQVETFFDRWMHLSSQPDWDLTFHRYAFYLMLVVLLLSFFGLVLNSLRMRRRTDSWRINLILVFLMSFSGVVYYLIVR